MYCICCKQDKIEQDRNHTDLSEEDYIWSVEKKELKTQEEIDYFGTKVLVTNTNNRMWSGGIVHIIDAGYGSSHDTDKFVIAICDDCITKESQDGTLLYHGNYMSSDSDWTQKEVDKSKQAYRRRKNLDKLV